MGGRTQKPFPLKDAEASFLFPVIPRSVASPQSRRPFGRKEVLKGGRLDFLSCHRNSLQSDLDMGACNGVSFLAGGLDPRTLGQ